MRRKPTTRSPSSPACSVWRARATPPGPAAHHPTGRGRMRCSANRSARSMTAAVAPTAPHASTPSCAWAWASMSAANASPAPDLVQRRFAPPGPDQLWVADITQQRTDQGWLYLAVVLDAFSRRVVGWSMADHLRTELVLDALEMAISQRQPPPGLVCHSDHGCQYTSFAYGRRLHASGLVASMGTVGDALDNAVAESFFATLECELLDRYPWPTRAGLRTAIFDFIEVFYNRQRRHSTLDYASPVSYEQQHVPAAPAA